jgi:hypothetical protein
LTGVCLYPGTVPSDDTVDGSEAGEVGFLRG